MQAAERIYRMKSLMILKAFLRFIEMLIKPMI